MTAGKAESKGPASSQQEIADFTYVSNPSVPGGLAVGENRFALRAESNALADEGIRAGDLVVLEAHQNPEDGETVVAVIGGKASVRRVYREATGSIRLEAQSKNLPPILAGAADVEIRGRVVALIRKYQNIDP
jgi:repressor LexA